MDFLEFLIIVIILGVLLFGIYYFMRGAKGDISLSHPMESRVDEYLDRRFAGIVEEWQLVTRPRLRQFKEQRYAELEQGEKRLDDLNTSTAEMQATLGKLEARLDNLEKELAQKGNAKK